MEGSLFRSEVLDAPSQAWLGTVRLATPVSTQAWTVAALLIGASILAVAYLLPLVYLGWSLLYGRQAGDNPWGATGLEWRTSSPPPKENFHSLPIVEEEPYLYHPPDTGPESERRVPLHPQGGRAGSPP